MVGLDRRVIVALAVVAVILTPAAVLRLVCAGHSCDEPEDTAANVPFCSLPDEQRRAIVNGFREGRSPDVLTVSDTVDAERVPLLFYGPGFGDIELDDGTTLDQIAPTLARSIDFERPHPDVRSGTPIPNAPTGSRARLILIVALKGIGASNFTQWEDIFGSNVVAIPDARTGSLPIDPAAIATTIGTGGRPSQHGITAGLIRDDSGRLVQAWGPGAPVSVIATLADDLDEHTEQTAKIALVGTARADRGLVGGNWYIERDRDGFSYAKKLDVQIAAVRQLFEAGYGDDDVPDVVGVALHPPPDRVNEVVDRLLQLGAKASDGRLVAAVAGTGASDNKDVNVSAIERAIPGRRPLIEAAVPGGFFVDQDALADTGLTEDEVIDAAKESGQFTDVFAAITVTFSRYC